MATNNTKDILSKVLIFAVGAAIGSAVTWKLVSTKYEKLIQKEIDDVKRVYSTKEETHQEIENKTEEDSDVGDAPSEYYEESLDDIRKRVSKRISERDRYESIINNQGYSNDEHEEKEKVDEDDYDMEEYEMTHIEPYIIAYEELGDCDYPVVTVVCHADGYIIYQEGKAIGNPEDLFGYNNDPSEYFEENPKDDTLCIRNENLGVDYEITRNLSNYLED